VHTLEASGTHKKTAERILVGTDTTDLVLEIYRFIEDNATPLVEVFEKGDASTLIGNLPLGGSGMVSGSPILTGGFREFLENKKQKSMCLLLCPVAAECQGLSIAMLQAAQKRSHQHEQGDTRFVVVSGIWYVSSIAHGACQCQHGGLHSIQYIDPSHTQTPFVIPFLSVLQAISDINLRLRGARQAQGAVLPFRRYPARGVPDDPTAAADNGRGGEGGCATSGAERRAPPLLGCLLQMQGRPEQQRVHADAVHQIRGGEGGMA
jgi:hypothetical protein